MGGILIAWLVGEGIVTYRSFKHGAPPTPGQLAAVSGFFVLLAVLGSYPPAKGTATAIAFGIDVAALLQILPGTKAPAVATLTAVGVDIAAFLQILPGSGQPVHLTRTWPPALINDPTVLLPGTAGAPPQNPSFGGSGPGGGSTPSGPNQNPPGTPVPPGQGVIFPPGSSVLLWRARYRRAARRGSSRR